MSRCRLSMLVCLLLAGAVHAQGADVSNTVLTVANNVTLAGTLNVDAAMRLRGTDTVVIDLRTPAEDTTEESHAMWRAGVTYINLPTTSAVPSPADVELFDAIIAANAERPIVVHCASGNRAGLLWAAHLLESGATLAQAEEAVQPVVTKAPIGAAIAGYAEQRAATAPD